MNPPLQITFRNVAPSPAVAAKIREAATKLDRYYARILSCRVIAEAPHRHQRHGEPFHLRIDLRVPGATIVIQRAPGLRQALTGELAVKASKRLQPNTRHKEMYVAVHDAFDAARRRLEDYVRRRRGDVKTHTRAAPRRKPS